MAKTPKKPASAGKPPAAKPAGAGKAGGSKAKPAVAVEKLEKGEQETYRGNAPDIDLALNRCVAHFRILTPSEAQVAIKLLKAYYMRYGITTSTGGMKLK